MQVDLGDSHMRLEDAQPPVSYRVIRFSAPKVRER